MDATAVQVEQYTEVSSPPLSGTLSPTGNTVLSGVCDALCFSALIAWFP